MAGGLVVAVGHLDKIYIAVVTPGRLRRYVVRITVDRLRCESNALCMGAAPEVFEVGDDDVLVVLQDSPPEALRGQVLDAVAMCPKQALTVAD
jgi:ferredoxin